MENQTSSSITEPTPDDRGQPKLTEDNFTAWRNGMLAVISNYKFLMKFLGGSHPCPADKYTDKKNRVKNPLYTEWMAIDSRIIYWIYTTISDTMLPCFPRLNASSRQLWRSINQRFTSSPHWVQLRTQLFSLKQGDRSVLPDLINEIKLLCDQLAAAGEPISTDELVCATLGALNSDYIPFITIMRYKYPPVKSIKQLEKLLRDEESVVRKRNEMYSTSRAICAAQISGRGGGGCPLYSSTCAGGQAQHGTSHQLGGGGDAYSNLQSQLSHDNHMQSGSYVGFYGPWYTGRGVLEASRETKELLKIILQGSPDATNIDDLNATLMLNANSMEEYMDSKTLPDRIIAINSARRCEPQSLPPSSSDDDDNLNGLMEPMTNYYAESSQTTHLQTGGVVSHNEAENYEEYLYDNEHCNLGAAGSSSTSSKLSSQK